MKLLSTRELRDLLVKSGYSLPVNYFTNVTFNQYEGDAMIYTVTIPDDSGISEFVTAKVEVTYSPSQGLVAELFDTDMM